MSFKKKDKKSRENSKFSVLDNKTENFIFIEDKNSDKQKIIIKKKIEKRANKRNKIRRRIREIIRNTEKEKNTLIVRKNVLHMKFSEMKKEINEKKHIKGEKGKSE